MNTPRLSIALCVALALIASPRPSRGDAQPGRIFPTHIPVTDVPADDQRNFPTSWSPQDVRWTADVDGYGQSSPAVWGDAAYLTSVIGENKETLQITCIDLATGKTRWAYSTPSTFPTQSGPMVSRAAPSPVVDAAGLYAFFESGDLLMLDHAGKLVWKRSLQSDHGTFVNKFGLSATPAQTADRLFVLLDHSGDSSLVGIDKASGTTAFVSDRGKRAHSWSSPAIIRVGQAPLVVCSSVGSIDAYSTAGKLLCSYSKVGGNSVATPYDLGDGEFLVSSLIRPADGPSENALVSNLLAKIVNQGDDYAIEVKWVADEARGSFSSPVKQNGFVYFINPQGILFCLDAQSGKQHYAKRTPSGACWATPFPVGDRLYLFGKDGTTSVIRVGETFDIISEGNRAWPADADAETNDQPPAPRPGAGPASGPTLYAAVPTSDGFLIRRGDRLYRIAPPTPSTR